MHRIMLTTTKKTIFATRLFAMSCDEVKTVDNQSSVNIQAYLAHAGSNQWTHQIWSESWYLCF